MLHENKSPNQFLVVGDTPCDKNTKIQKYTDTLRKCSEIRHLKEANEYPHVSVIVPPRYYFRNRTSITTHVICVPGSPLH